MIVELRHLRYFVAVAAHGSFNRAAQGLHLTQPALSRQVKDLEEEIQIPLLVRGKNSVTLTESGKLFYEEAREVLARADLAIQRVRGESRPRVLRVGYSPSVTSDILPLALQRFHADHPGVRIELTDLFPEDMTRMAGNGELDVLIALESSVTAIPDFHWKDLRQSQLVLVMPANHELAALKHIPPHSLRDVALVGLAQDSFPAYVPHVRMILKPFGIKPRFVMLERDGVATMLATLEAYNAAAILADSAVNSMPRSLVYRPFLPRFDPIIARIGWTAAHAEPYARLFVDLLCAAAERKKPSRSSSRSN